MASDHPNEIMVGMKYLGELGHLSSIPLLKMIKLYTKKGMSIKSVVSMLSLMVHYRGFSAFQAISHLSKIFSKIFKHSILYDENMSSRKIPKSLKYLL